MPKCGICGGEAPRQPGITEEGKCDLCGKELTLAELLNGTQTSWKETHGGGMN